MDKKNILFFLTPKEEVAYLDEDDSLRQAMEKMQYHRYSSIPILTADGRYMGTITEGDLLWTMKAHNFSELRDAERVKITDINRRRDNEAVNIRENMEQLLEKATNQNFVPVVDDRNIFIGIVTRRAILLYIAGRLHESGEKSDGEKL